MGCFNDPPVPRATFSTGSDPAAERPPLTEEAADDSPVARAGGADGEWRAARDDAARLARRLQYLTWPDRARVLDEYFWSRARATLSSDSVTAVINRKLHELPNAEDVRRYARYCGSVVATALSVLGDQGAVVGEPHALTLSLSTTDAHRLRAADWIAAQPAGALGEQLRQLPGYAFLSLTCHPNDSAESFMARDAFWTAMLGNA